MVEARGEAFEAVPGERQGEEVGLPKSGRASTGQRVLRSADDLGKHRFSPGIPAMFAVRHGGLEENWKQKSSLKKSKNILGQSTRTGTTACLPDTNE